MIAMNLSKQQALHADPRTIQKINFTANNTVILFILVEARETVLDFSQGPVKAL